MNGKAWASAAELGIEASAIVSNAVSIVPVDHSTGISIRQTTSTGNVTVFSPADASIKIRDLSGRTLSTYSTDGQLTIPMNFPNGIYLICVYTKEMPNAASLNGCSSSKWPHKKHFSQPGSVFTFKRYPLALNTVFISFPKASQSPV